MLESMGEMLEKNLMMKSVSRFPRVGRLKTTQTHCQLLSTYGGLLLPDAFYQQPSSKFQLCRFSCTTISAKAKNKQEVAMVGSKESWTPTQTLALGLMSTGQETHHLVWLRQQDWRGA